MKVCINAGHGGKDVGAVGFGLKEVDINYSVAKEVERILKLHKVEVVFIQQNDNDIKTLTDICRVAKNSNANLFVSIHHNAGGGEGFEVIHSIRMGESYKLAQLLAKEFKVIGQQPHGLGVYSRASTKNPKKDYYEVIRGTIDKMPSIIGEFAFIDNLKDVNKINTEEKRKEEAKAYAKAILNYLGIKYDDELVNPKKLYGIVLANVLNVRKTPEIKKGNIIMTYKKDTKVELLEKKGDWYRTKDGWVYSGYLKIIKE